MQQHFRMFAAYNRWANAEVYDAAGALREAGRARNVGGLFGLMLGTRNPLLVSGRIWMKRFTGEGEAPKALDTVLFTDFARLRAAREAEDRRIVEWIETLTPKALAGRFTYMTVTDLRTVSQRLSPALAHFFNHQTHHRGQAHMILTALGKPSLSLDLIYFQRTPEGREFA